MSDSYVDTVRLDASGSRPERFEILERLGEGGMGVVYRARSVEDGTVVALKVISASGDPARFSLEIRALSTLRHEGIVRYHSHGKTHGGQPYLAMEWIDGETLQERVTRERLPPTEVVRIGKAIASALAHAHAEGIVHRDLKPTNVMLDHAGHVKLVDFGVARIAELGRGLTATGHFVGTAGYMAPEQARNEPVDGRADLFALGCVLYFAASGRRPFEGDSPEAYLTKLLFEPVVPLHDRVAAVSRSLSALVGSLLARDPAHRPATADEVVAEFERIERGDSTAVEDRDGGPDDRTLASPVLSPTRSGRAKPARWMIVALPLLVVAGGVVGARALKPDASEPSPTIVPRSATSTIAPAEDLRRACREWAMALTAGQHDSGGFSGEEHRGPSAWDTGQVLFALARAKSACDAPVDHALEQGTLALSAARMDAGWPGLGPSGAAELPSTAWAALAAGALERAGVAPRESAKALSFVRGAEHADGAFSFDGSVEGRVDPYTSVVAAWALVDRARSSEDRAAQSAASFIARSLANGDASFRSLGLEEQAGFVIYLAEAKGLRVHDDGVSLTLAHDASTRCALDAGACTRPLTAVGTLALDVDAGSGRLVSLWHPWLIALTSQLSADGRLPPPERDVARAMERFSVTELLASIPMLSVAPTYKLAEYLIVVTYLLGDDRAH